MKSPIFWDITPCSLLVASVGFGGTCRLDLQCNKINQARNQHEAGSSQAELGSFLDLEKEGDIILRNIG
jgi:hypothetical protein